MSVEEFALRPLAANRQQFEDIAAMIRRRQLLTAPSSYMVLDSLPTGGSPTDPRTQIATLAYYYLVGNPDSTFLMFYGGDDPNSSWREHWSPAAAYNGSWDLEVAKKQALSARALADLDRWIADHLRVAAAA